MADTKGNDPKAGAGDTKSGAVKPPVLDLTARETPSANPEASKAKQTASKPEAKPEQKTAGTAAKPPQTPPKTLQQRNFAPKPTKSLF